MFGLSQIVLFSLSSLMGSKKNRMYVSSIIDDCISLINMIVGYSIRFIHRDLVNSLEMIRD